MISQMTEGEEDPPKDKTTNSSEYDKETKDSNDDFNLYLPSIELPGREYDLTAIRKLIHTRLLVLFAVKAINRRTNQSAQTRKEKMIKILQKYKLPQYLWLLTHNGVAPSSPEEQEFMENEIISHIYLNVVFHPWNSIIKFIHQQEMTLFEWQTMSYATPQVMDFLKRNEIKFPEATQEEKKAFQKDLEMFNKSDHPFNLENIIYKVPYLYALKLISHKDILVRLGNCYIPEDRMKDTLSSLYHSHLEVEKMTKCYEYLDINHLGRDRATFLRCSLLSIYLSKNRRLRRLQFDIKQIDKTIDCFPPCFRRIYDELNKTHHLKHFSRLQFYQLLNGVNANPNDVHAYMKEQFVKKGHMPEKYFGEHTYYIYHAFGMKGNCIEYDTPDCSHNINSMKRPGEVNGCPFGSTNDRDIEDLGKHLNDWKIPVEAQQKIKELTVNRECSRACGTFFEVVHGVKPNHEILNPVDFYAARMDAFKLENSEGKEDEYKDEEMEEELVFKNIFQDSSNNVPGIFDKNIRKTVIDTVKVDYGVNFDPVFNEEAEKNIEDWEGFEEVWNSRGRRHHATFIS